MESAIYWAVMLAGTGLLAAIPFRLVDAIEGRRRAR